VPEKRRSLKVVHLLLHLVALVAGVLGITAAFKSKKEAALPDMYTLHSWLGMSAICLFGLQVTTFIYHFALFLFSNLRSFQFSCDNFLMVIFSFQYIMGFFSYFFPGAEMSTRASLLPWHRFLGMAIFLLAVATAETGLAQYFQFLQLFRSQEALIVNSTALLLFLYALFVALSVILPRNYS